MIPAFWKSGLRNIIRHPWQFGLAILGVAVGVAVVISIDVANNSARRAFNLSSESVTGRATDQITDSSFGIPDSLFKMVKVKLGVKDAAPIVERYVTLPGHPGWTLNLLGIDPFSEAPFRPYLKDIGSHGSFDITSFITGHNLVDISDHTARELGLSIGDTLHIQMGPRIYVMHIGGLIKPQGAFNSEVIRDVMLTDISTAQILTRRLHHISNIDLIIPKGKKGKILRRKIKANLPPQIHLIPVSKSKQTVQKMTAAFNLNLEALSMLGLIVGMFLIYNIITFSVVQQRPLIGRLRAIGITRRQIFAQILGEALIIGILGTTIGIFLGIALAGVLIHLITRTINDLYYVLSVNQLHITAFTLSKGIILGIIATLAAAAIPAYEATHTEPGMMSKSSVKEERLKKKLYQITIAAFILLIAGWGVLYIPSRSLVLSYMSMFAIIIGFALLTPGIIILVSKWLPSILKSFAGITPIMAARGLGNQLSRTSVAIAALMVAVSATVGLGIMVSSFRYTLVRWLDTTLQADIYIFSPSVVPNHPNSFLSPEMVKKLKQIPGIEDIETMGRFVVSCNKGEAPIEVVNMPRIAEENYEFKSGNPKTAWHSFNAGKSVFISEPYAFKHHLRVGSSIRFATSSGRVTFKISGIYYDYGSNEGTVLIPSSVFQKYWHIKKFNGISLFLKKGINKNKIEKEIRKKVGIGKILNINSNKALRKEAIAVFNRTFTITTVLQLLIAGVAFVGVFGALMALEIEKKKELAVLRALGFTPGQVSTLITSETGLMGIIAGILAIPVGMILAAMLIYVINQRSFGWTFQFIIPIPVLWQAIILAVLSALIAGIYPAYRMSKTSPAAALHED